MTNDLTGVSFEEFLPCFALSKNDSYVVSASKGMISLFNMLTFKVTYKQIPWLLGDIPSNIELQ